MTGEPTDRVTMLWPSALKEKVRDRAGHRGLTSFTVEAVVNHLMVADRQKQLEKELSETKYLAQLLADRIAMGGDYQDRHEALMEVDLPHWIDTQGWPDEYAELVKPELVEVAEPVTPVPATPTPVFQSADSRPVPEPPLPHDAGGESDDLFAKIRAKAAEKGVDIDGMGLKRASDIPAQPEPELPTEALPKLARGVRAPTQVAPPLDACPKCGEELVAGECWTCP